MGNTSGMHFRYNVIAKPLGIISDGIQLGSKSRYDSLHQEICRSDQIRIIVQPMRVGLLKEREAIGAERGGVSLDKLGSKQTR